MPQGNTVKKLKAERISRLQAGVFYVGLSTQFTHAQGVPRASVARGNRQLERLDCGLEL